MKPQFKVGDNCDTEEFGCVVIQAIYQDLNNETNFIYGVSPLNNLTSEWYLTEPSLSIPV
jgi:hypothetical protein